MEKVGVVLAAEQEQAFLQSMFRSQEAVEKFGQVAVKIAGQLSGFNQASSQMVSVLVQVEQHSTEAANSANQLHKATQELATHSNTASSALTKAESSISNAGHAALSAASHVLNLGKEAAGAVGHLAGLAGSAAVHGMQEIGGAALSAAGHVAELGLKLVETGLKAATSFAKSSISAYQEFSQVISEVGAVSGASASEMQQLEDKALELGAKFPVSAKDAAQAESELAKAGFNAQQTLAASTGVVQLASATHMDMAKSAEVLAGAINEFGLSASDATRVTDLLAQTANASAVDVKDIAETFKYAGPAAKAAGFSIEDLSKATALMGNNAIKGSSAGTGLKAIITQLVNPSDKAKAAFDQLGYSITDSAGKVKPLQQQLSELRDKFSGLSQQEKIDLATKIVGKDHFTKLLALVNSNKEAFDQVSEAIDGASGAGERMAKTMNDNLAGSVENMKGSVETLQIKLGKALSPAFRAAADAVANLANKMGPWADKMAGPIARAVDRVKGALSDLTLGLTAPMKLIQGEQLDGPFVKLGLVIRENIIPAVKDFIDRFGPLVGKAFELYQAFSPLNIALDVFKGYMSGGTSGAMAAFGEALNNIGGNLDRLVPKVLTVLRDLLDTVITWVQAHATEIADGLLAWGIKFVEWVAPVAGQLLSKLVGLLTDLLNWVAGHAGEILNKLAEWAKAFIEWVGPLIPPLLAALANVAIKIGEWIVGAIPDLVTQLGKWGAEFINWIGPKIPDMLTKLGELATSVFNWIVEQAPKVLEKVAEWAKGFIDWIGPKIPVILAELGKIIAGVVGWIGEQIPVIAGKLGEWASAFINWVGPKIPELLGKLGELLLSVIGWLGDHLPDIVAKLVEWGAAFIGWVGKEVLPKLPGILLGILEQIGIFIGNAIPVIASNLTKWALKFVEWVAQAIVQLPGKLAEFLGTLLVWITDTTAKILEAAIKIGESLVAGIIKGIQNTTGGLKGFLDQWSWTNIVESTKNKLGVHSPSSVFESIGQDVVQGLIQGITSKSGDASTATSDLVQGVVNTAKNKSDGLYGAGQALATGMANGIYAGKSGVISAAISVAQAAISAAFNTLGAHSPSKVFMDLGKFTMQGLEQGIKLNSSGPLAALNVALDRDLVRPAASQVSNIVNWPASYQQIATSYNNNLVDSQNVHNHYNLTMQTNASPQMVEQSYQIARLMGV